MSLNFFPCPAFTKATQSSVLVLKAREYIRTKGKRSRLVSLKPWNGVNHYSGFTFSWDQGHNSKLIKQIPLIMQRRSHKVTGGSMFYIHEHIIKILRRAIKFYILILHPTALSPLNKKIRLLMIMFVTKVLYVCHWSRCGLFCCFYHWTIKNNFYPFYRKIKCSKKKIKSPKS